jgi:hypothetical protein
MFLVLLQPYETVVATGPLDRTNICCIITNHAKTKSQGLASQLSYVVEAKVLKGSNWISPSNKPDDRSDI